MTEYWTRLRAVGRAVSVVGMRYQRDTSRRARPLLVEMAIAHEALLYLRRILGTVLHFHREHVARRMVIADDDLGSAAHQVTVVRALRCPARKYVAVREAHVGLTPSPSPRLWEAHRFTAVTHTVMDAAGPDVTPGQDAYLRGCGADVRGEQATVAQLPRTPRARRGDWVWATVTRTLTVSPQSAIACMYGSRQPQHVGPW